MPLFEFSSLIHAAVEEVFAFHERGDALELLTPPWQEIRILERKGGLDKGSRVVFSIPMGPFRMRWVAEHTAYQKDRLFVDEQISGPFRQWVHRHRFDPVEDGTRLTDSIDFSLHGGVAADLAGAWLVRLMLRRMFRYRHQVTRRECERRVDGR